MVHCKSRCCDRCVVLAEMNYTLLVPGQKFILIYSNNESHVTALTSSIYSNSASIPLKIKSGQLLRVEIK